MAVAERTGHGYERSGDVADERWDTSGWLSWANWRMTVGLMLALLALRVGYLIWLCPWDLVEDEAHYWDWSRHLSLSYYSKGPGVAWAIWLSTSVLGTSEWAIRLPAALASAAAVLALARLTIDVTGGDERAGFLAAAAFCLVPIFQVDAQVMTIDGPFLACWILAMWAAWRAFERHRVGRGALGLWALTGLILGVGFLFKYTIVLLPPSLLLYAVLRRRELPWDRRLTVGAVVCALVFAVVISPVFIWNWQNGWPMVSHGLGHLGAPGGDRPTQWTRPFAGFNLHEFAASEIGVIGPPVFVLVVLATLWASRRRRRRRPGAPRLYLLTCGLPIIGFFTVISLVSRVEANWPIAGFTSLLVLVAWGTRQAVAEWRRQRADWEHKASAMLIRLPRPRNTWRTAWRWAIGFGVFTQLIVFFPNYAAKLPLVGQYVPLSIVMGAEQLATRAETAVALVRERTGEQPFIMAASAGKTSRLAYYMHGRPTVYDAGGHIGIRPSAYNYFPDTDLRAPALLGRPAVMVNLPLETWREGFRFGETWSLGGVPPIHIGLDYGGMRPYHTSSIYRE